MSHLLLSRRRLLASVAATWALSAAGASARSYAGNVPWEPFAISEPEKGWSGEWRFFTPQEQRTMGALAETMIPADDLSPSGREAGCVEFIDGQLAGSYGTNERLYMIGPFRNGTPQQGDQLPWTMSERYRMALASLGEFCRREHGGEYETLDEDTRIAVLQKLEAGDLPLSPIPAQVFFRHLLDNVMEGFFADPIYGGNRDMASWRMIGFPGARYDFRPWVTQYNTRLDMEPVSLTGGAAWTTRTN